MEDIDNLITLHFIRRLQRTQLYLSNENFKSVGELKAVSLSYKKTAKILKYEEIRTPQFYLTLKIYIWRVTPLPTYSELHYLSLVKHLKGIGSQPLQNDK